MPWRLETVEIAHLDQAALFTWNTAAFLMNWRSASLALEDIQI
jgi:hypothetical protein